MVETPPRLTVVLGIDPGRNTGLYSVAIPTVSHALTLDEFQQHARWLGNAVISLSTSKRFDTTRGWLDMHQRIATAIDVSRPELIVIEHPVDAMPKWTPGGFGGQRGTEFTIGMYFGFAALAAATWADEAINGNPSIALMPVTSSKAKDREGWMPRVRGKRNNLHTQDKDTTLRQCRQIASRIFLNAHSPLLTASQHAQFISEHELMALGVLTYYVTHRPPAEWGK
jgi:hypothetical protein